MRKVKLLSISISAALIIGAVFTPAAMGASKKSNVKKLTFTATTVSGTQFNSKILLQKKPSVLWFWAPWCAICQNESAGIVATAQKYKNKVNFVGVGALGNTAELQEFIDKTGTSVITNIDDSSGVVWKRFGVVIQPTLIFVDKKGKITTKMGPSDTNFLESRIKTLTAK
jgi:thiol-disulfide isomerase/thioredoxin